MNNEKWKTKNKKRKKRKNCRFYIKEHRSVPNFFRNLLSNISFSRSPPTWTYMGELNIPFSGRVSSFAEFLFRVPSIKHEKNRRMFPQKRLLPWYLRDRVKSQIVFDLYRNKRNLKRFCVENSWSFRQLAKLWISLWYI